MTWHHGNASRGYWEPSALIWQAPAWQRVHAVRHSAMTDVAKRLSLIFRPKLTHPAARSLCYSLATCYFYFSTCKDILSLNAQVLRKSSKPILMVAVCAQWVTLKKDLSSAQRWIHTWHRGHMIPNFFSSVKMNFCAAWFNIPTTVHAVHLTGIRCQTV